MAKQVCDQPNHRITKSGEVTATAYLGPPRTVLLVAFAVALQRNDTSVHVANLSGLEINLFSSSNQEHQEKKKKATDTTRVRKLAN